VPEQVPRQVKIRKTDRRQKREYYCPAVDHGDGLRTLKRRFQLFARLVQRRRREP